MGSKALCVVVSTVHRWQHKFAIGHTNTWKDLCDRIGLQWEDSHPSISNF